MLQQIHCEIVLLTDENHLVLRVFTIRAFLGHYFGQKLIVKAIFCHNEVEKSARGLYLSRIASVANLVRRMN